MRPIGGSETGAASQIDPVGRYRAASEDGDLAAVIDTLAPDVELVSPISAILVFQGARDVGTVLGAVFASLTKLRWTHQAVGDGRIVLIGEARVAGLRLTDAMVLEVAPDGRIYRITPHLRPWLALTALGLQLLVRFSRAPRVLVRAWRSGRHARRKVSR